MIFFIKLVGINGFWVNASISKDEMTKTIRDFDRERGRYGFVKVPATKQNTIINDFCNKYGFTIAYKNVIDRELQIRERTAKWLYRRLVNDYDIGISSRMISKYVSGSNIPKGRIKEAIEDLLCISLNKPN